MNKILNKINELHICADSEYGYHITYRVAYPYYTKSFFTEFDNFEKIIEIIEEDIEDTIKDLNI